MKVKDIMRKFGTDSGTSKTVIKEAKQLDRMISRGSKKRRVNINDDNPAKANSITWRVRSIQPVFYYSLF